MPEALVSSLPPELWIKILKFMPSVYLPDISAISHLFHDLAAPILFSTLYLRPGITVETSTSGTRLRRELDRLTFWSSDAIAPLVRKCFISLYYTSITLVPQHASMPLGAAVFEAISKFQNLRSLSCNISPSRPVELVALQNGDQRRYTVALHRSNCPATQNPYFSYGAIPAVSESVSGICMLDPTHLRSLELAPFHPRGIEDFLDDARAMAEFRNLRTLRLTFPDTDFTRIHACIAPFPAVRELIVYLNGSCRADAILPAPLAPHLESFWGPSALLPLVLAGSAPEELTVTQGSAADVLEALQTAMHLDFVKSLSMGDILGLCPSLTRLTLDVLSDANEGDDLDAVTLSQRLVEILRSQSTLETLVLRWRLPGRERHAVPNRSELETMLRSTFPGLRVFS
ncbi:hypothetical protein DFH08DRAFT_932497 [Mycena albidolilacea]|uniref:F-box domain-containing protein n=1 Tax=Mycena albidolilacea TaxID=1033008 RepID=A0AAD7AGY9_9AGAR|nr:hypothetical protein DFH08DRAFT_932497 [Mycena albidolilacea]